MPQIMKHQNLWTLITMRTIFTKLIRRVLKILKKSLADISVRLNTKRKIHMVLKIEMI